MKFIIAVKCFFRTKLTGHKFSWQRLKLKCLGSCRSDLISLYSYKTGSCTNLNCTHQHMKSTHAQSIIYGVSICGQNFRSDHGGV